MLHVAQISFFLDPQQREPAQLLQDWPSLVDVAEAVQGVGTQVSVIQACTHREDLRRNRVDYYFLPPDNGASTIACTPAFADLIRNLRADVFHVHGLGFPSDVFALARLSPETPILLQDHANGPPGIWRRHLWRRGLSVVSAIAFCARAQARPFAKFRLIGADTQIYEIPESSSRFTAGDQAEARRATGLNGDPCLLWVGHLNANKDPLTVLEGVSRAARYLPALQLWCCFGAAPLLSDVQARIERDPALRGRVHLLGQVTHVMVEQLMRAADLFVLGSHREGSGYSLIEALACGLPPVVTDIPSFRTLTAEGTIGQLWPCGDAEGLCRALVSVASALQSQSRETVRAHFDRELSFDAVGGKLTDAYQKLLGHETVERRPTSQSSTSGVPWILR